MSRAATTVTVGDQITSLLTGFALTTAAREIGVALRRGGAAAGAPAAAGGPGARSAGAARAPHHAACAAPRSCRPARRSRRSTKAACRRRWCVDCTSSPRATSWTTRPMCWPSACRASARATRCAPSATRSSTAATPCSSCRPTASCRSCLAAKRNLELPRALRKLDHFAVLLLDDVGLHPAESRGGRDSLHAARRTLRATLGLHHQQSDLRAVGSDLSRSDGDGGGDRSPGASLGAAGIRCPQLSDRAGEAARQSRRQPSGGRLVTETDRTGCPRIDDRPGGRPEGRPVWHAHARTRPIATSEEAVDAAGPVDAQTRPPRLGKRRTVSHSAHRHPRPLDQGERTPDKSHSRPATGQRQLPEPAAVASGLIRQPFAGRNSCR